MSPVTDDKVRAAFAAQARQCESLGSRFMAQLCTVLGRGLDRSTAVGRRVLSWSGEDPEQDAVPLRLAGGLHALVRAGRAADFAAAYPPHPPVSDDALWDRLARVMAGDDLLPWLDSPPQTNEVLRSSLLMAGLAVITQATGVPLSLCELGTSAGLNLLLDRYGHRLGGRFFGDRQSSLQLQPRWSGDPPPEVAPRVVGRRGNDLQPLDVTRSEDRDRIMAYVWADEAERLDHCAKALAIARAEPPPIDAGNAVAWLERCLTQNPEEGVGRVLLHTIAVRYFSPADQERISALLAEAGAKATARTPLARLAYEAPETGGATELRLTLWPGGEDRLLATGDIHGDHVEWKGPA